MSDEDDVETVGLPPGEAFELTGPRHQKNSALASDVRRELLNQVPSGDRDALIRRFGMVKTTAGQNWIDIFLEGDEGKLIALAEFLGVPIPGQSDDAEATDELSAAHIEPYAELISAETALRDVIRAAVPNWIDDFTAEQVKKLENKRAEEDKRRDGIAVSQDLLNYTEIHELQNIINKHWNPDVKAILDDKKRTEVYLGIIFDVRNTISHSRPIFAAERLLLAGAAGQIRNQLARYRTKADGPERHYPSIDSARDSMGKDGWHSPKLLRRPYSAAAPLQDVPRLDVGATIIFELEATDPRGRELIWKRYSIPEAQMPTSVDQKARAVDEMNGQRIQMTWTVSDDDVGEYRQIVLTVSNSGRYHRERSWDDAVIFHYHINPPPDA